MREQEVTSLLTLLAAVLLLSGKAVAAAKNVTSAYEECEYGWQRFRGKCFHFLGTTSSHTFEEAKYECSRYFRASLATIKSEEEQKFVEQLLKRNVIFKNVWLGAKWMPETIFAKSGYQWIDESPLFYHNKLLSPDLIRGNSSMCLAMFTQAQYFGIWTPFNCSFYFHVLCQRSLTSASSTTHSASALFLYFTSSLILARLLNSR